MAPDTDIQKFRWGELGRFTHLFNQVNGISDSEKAFDVEFMGEFLSQPSCRPEENCYLAISQGAPVGFVLIAPERPISRAVGSGGVLDSHRGQGIGRKLLRTAIEHAGSLEATVLHIAAPSEGPHARLLLESEGFLPIKSYWQLRRRGGEASGGELPEGFSLRSFELGRDEEGLTRLQNAAFSRSWGFCPNTVEEIWARVRLKRCDPEGIILVTNGNLLAGYNWTLRASSEAGSVGWIAMTGVHPDYRSRGLGRAVVGAGIEYLRAKKVDAIELEVDADNRPATELYLKLGFSRVGQTVWYEKSLD